MTVVAVKKEKKKIIISADRLIKIWDNIRKTKKLKKVGKIIFWGAWYLSELQIMENFLIDNWYDKNTIKSEKEIFNTMSNFYKYLKEKWVMDSREDYEKTVINNFIIVIENLGKVYRYDEWCLLEVEDYDAIWSWGTVANTVMSMWGDTKQAVEKANELNLYCGLGCDTLEVKI